MYRYKDAAKDIRGLTTFALHKYKDQRGHRIPEPPTALEQFYEQVKERAIEILVSNYTLKALKKEYIFYGNDGIVSALVESMFL